MRKTLAVVFALGIATVASAQYKTGKATPNAKGSPVKMTMGVSEDAVKAVKRISIDEAIELVEAGKAIYVDVRSKEQYDIGHIKGAINLPNSQLIARLKEVPPGKMLITYCACSAEQSSGTAVVDLNAHGFKNAAALTGGYNSWKAMNLPIETTK
jgi:rhodanese-related sulfurtransferase